jgi:acetyl esterase/lipase
VSWQLRLLLWFLRHVEKPHLRRVKDPATARADFARAARLGFRDPPAAFYLPDHLGDVPALWVGRGVPASDAVLLWFHGGAYVMGAPATHRGMVARLAGRAGMRAVLPDYAKAPEHPFPAALGQARAAWDALIARGYRPDRIALGGDSAGGGLMLALLADLCAEGRPPAAALGFSPWTDLTLTGASLAENADADPLLPVERVAETRDYYLAGADPRDPRASPLFAHYPSCPPVFLQAARTEVLRDDTLRLAERLRAQGAEVTLDLWDDLPHVWQIFQDWVPEATTALNRAALFLRQVFSPGGS